MAEDEVELYGSELTTVEKYKQRLRHLFCVSVSTSFIALRDDGAPSKIRLSTPQSQENIEKAKIYLHAVIGTGSDIVHESQVLQIEDFEMVCKNCDRIESLTQAVVRLMRDSQEVRLQGNVRSVRIARELISLLVQNGETLFPPADSSDGLSWTTPPSCLSLKEDGDRFQDHCSYKQVDNSSSDTDNQRVIQLTNNRTTKTNKCISKLDGDMDSNFYLTERGCSPSCSPVTDDQLFASERLCLCLDSRDSGNSSRSLSGSASPNSSDCELTVEGVLADPDYTTRVERAVKLGYSYDQLVMALRKLGKKADENQLLSEMIKMGSVGRAAHDASKLNGDTVDDDSLDQLDTDVVDIGLFEDESDNLRDIVIDGSNVAMSHGKDVFSCRGIKLAVEWFQQRGHKNITVFVPQWRKESSRPDAPIKDQEILTELERERHLSFTPARRVGGRRVVCYDDRYVLQLASEVNGIVVSNDNYRDLLNEKPEFKKVIEERLLMYSFAGDRFMPPEDPLGRHGPSLDNFLRKKPTTPEAQPPECPYGKKCTYGNKCRFYHPERRNMPHKSVTEKLQEQAKQKMEERATKIKEAMLDKKQTKNDMTKKMAVKKTPLTRTQSLVPQEMMFKPPSGRDEEEEKKQERKISEDYNEKLNEHRKKLEKAIAQTTRDCDTSTAVISRDASTAVSHPCDQFTVRSVPSPSEIISPPLNAANCFAQRIPQSGFSSPSSQLKVPTGSPNEELVSGHLLLAKKLSDEGADSKFFRARGTADTNVQSPQIAMMQTQQPKMMNLSQRLDRHLSLHGREDQTKFPVNALNQDETDSMFMQQQQYLSGPTASPLRFQHDPMTYIPGREEQCQSFPLAGREMMGQQVQEQQTLLGQQVQEQQTLLGQQVQEQQPAYMEHKYLSHVPSASDGRRMSQSAGKHLMVQIERQNSSSDPQIHLTGQEMDYVRQLNPGMSPFQKFERKRLAQPMSRNPLSRSTSVQPQSVRSMGSIGRQMSEVYCSQPQQVAYDYDDMMSPDMSSNHASGCEALYQGHSNWGDAYNQPQMHQRLAYQQMQSQDRFLSKQTCPPHPQNHFSNLSQGHPNQHVQQQQHQQQQQQHQLQQQRMLLPQQQHMMPSQQHVISQQQQQQHALLSQHHALSQQQNVPPSQFGSNVLSMQSQQQALPTQLPTQIAQQVSSPQPLQMQSPEPQSSQSFAPDAPIHPTDARFSMYYNLCGLFSEPTVRRVMNQHPQEMDPQEICAYIIGAK